ncbi:MAG: HAD family hydrolase [Candidatus Amulumruptor caecigallinarius]|nr:HAD family hydrolase [Candidatus Amulumruptor caecigallinarius]
MNIDVSKIKGLIFDYGGTLDTGGEHWSHVIWRAYQNAGVEVNNAEFREAYVYAERELARVRHILPAHDFHDMLKIKVKIELEFLVRSGLMSPDAVEEKTERVAAECYESAHNFTQKAAPVLEALSQKYPMVMVSNFYGNIDTVLRDFELRQYFRAIIESSVLGIRKPDPRIFEHGVKALGLMPSDVLVIGDSYKKDIVPAEQIGCQAIWLKGNGWTDEENAPIHSNVITEIERLTEILLDKEG